MQEANDQVIAPRSAPLSHLQSESAGQRFKDRLDWRFIAVGVVVVAVIAFAWSWRPDAVSPAANSPAAPTQGAAIEPRTPASSEKQRRAPFAQTQHERAREKAQDALAAFVERQIALEDEMQVATWGEAQFADAMALAKQGDADFLAEEFETALDNYDKAANALEDLIELGNQKFAQHLDSALTDVRARKVEAASQAVAAALVIKPQDAQALALRQRVNDLPDLVRLLRTAKNHELGGRYGEALAIYEQVEKLDPETDGIAEMKADVRAAVAGNTTNSHISNGFAALEEGRFDRARRAFRSALKIDPQNAIAKGGLQQVDERNDLAVIARQRRTADAALTREAWQDAIDAYQAVLDIDSNLRFAVDGKASATRHLKTQDLLTKISSEPQKLASERLYLEAQDILSRARQLDHAGPNMEDLIGTVADLLVTYRDPVDVVLLSDNATEIIVSNVGRLGRFEEKILSLRPGEYTIRGSQNGCKDLYLTVEILPGIEPLNLSCAEKLGR